MKRLLKTTLPGALMLLLICFMRSGKDILTGIYILFPILYIAAGAVCSGFAQEFLPCMLLTSVAFIVPINAWFRMGSCLDLLLIYIALAFISRAVQVKFNKRRSK